MKGVAIIVEIVFYNRFLTHVQIFMLELWIKTQ